MKRTSYYCPSCPVDLSELNLFERLAHLRYHENGPTWKPQPSQDVKPDPAGDINESRRETQQTHIGWRMH
jgi:hypothetical protein